METYHLRSLRFRIPKLCINFLKVVVGNNFVNKSIRLSFEQICCTMMLTFSSSSWLVLKKSFGEMCFDLSHIIQSLFVWVSHVVMSSYSIVGRFLLEDKSHAPRMCWVIDLSHTHSWLASCIAKISTWFEEVVIMACFTNYHDIEVPPQVNR